MGKRPQPRLRIDALTGEWRNGEAGQGRGSEPCEPGGLCHQAGGASWRAPHYDLVGRISPGPSRWPPGAKRRLVPAKSNLKPETSLCVCVFSLRTQRTDVFVLVASSLDSGYKRALIWYRHLASYKTQ